jgi:hypothetical protein
MWDQSQLAAARQRYEDLCREVETERLRRSLLPPRHPWYAPALAWLGNTLVAWGWRLRSRYARLELNR